MGRAVGLGIIMLWSMDVILGAVSIIIQDTKELKPILSK
jgi:hypothetical protein